MRRKNAFEKDFQADTHTLHLMVTVNDFLVKLSLKQLSPKPFQGLVTPHLRKRVLLIWALPIIAQLDGT